VENTYTVHWKIKNKYNDHDVTLNDVKPAGLKITLKVDRKDEVRDLEGFTVKKGTELTFDQTGVAGTATSATLSFAPQWDDEWPDPHKTYTGTVPLDGKCGKPECPKAGTGPQGSLPLPPTCSPSASPSPTGGTGGGAASPTPSKSATAPALPVTGAQTGLLAGGALVLLGAGAGMFFLARRRRLKFEA
jgi:hypothetical protein